MSLANIVLELDAYLLRLQQARDLLAESIGVERRGKPFDDSARGRRRSGQSRGNTARRTRQAEKPQLPANLPSAKAAASEKPLPIATRPTSPSVTQAPPLSTSSENKQAAVPQRKRVRTRRVAQKPKSAEGAPALGGAVPAGWIGVSAEEAKRARKQHVPQATLARFEAPAPALAGR